MLRLAQLLVLTCSLTACLPVTKAEIALTTSCVSSVYATVEVSRNCFGSNFFSQYESWLAFRVGVGVGVGVGVRAGLDLGG